MIVAMGINRKYTFKTNVLQQRFKKLKQTMISQHD